MLEAGQAPGQRGGRRLRGARRHRVDVAEDRTIGHDHAVRRRPQPGRAHPGRAVRRLNFTRPLTAPDSLIFRRTQCASDVRAADERLPFRPAEDPGRGRQPAYAQARSITILQAFGVHPIFEAADGERAWTMLRDTNPDVIFLDWMMDGMTGLDLARKMRTATSRRPIRFVPIIMLTGYTQHRSGAGSARCRRQRIPRQAAFRRRRS